MGRGRSGARRWIPVAVLAVLVAAPAACGGDDGGPDASAVGIYTDETDAADAGTSPGSGSDRQAASETVTRTIDRTGWWGGFEITIDEVELADAFVDSATVTITATYENLTDDLGYPPVPTLEVDGEAVQPIPDLPDVPARGRADGTITATVDHPGGDPDELLDTVVVVFGDAGDNQTRIPLAADGTVDSVEPEELSVTGTLTHGQIIVEVVDGSLAPSYESGEKGKALLDLRVRISCAADCQASGYNTSRDQFSVSGPGGKSVVADSRSRYCCDAIYPGDVSDDEDNVITFVVPAPGTGSYTLTYDNDSFSGAGTPPATLTFTA